MKKEMIFIFSIFLVFGILLATPFILADGDDDNNSNNQDDDSEERDDENETEEFEYENETDDEEKFEYEYEYEREIENATGKFKYKEKVKINSQNRIKYEYGQEIELPENCRQTGSVTKCNLGNGTRQMTIMAGKSGNMIVQSKGINMSTKVELFQSEKGLFALLNDNSTKAINYLPDEIKNKLKEKINYKINDSEMEIELDEEGEYEINYQKEAKFLGMFKIKEKVRAKVNSETGELIRERNSWWGFLAKDVLEDEENNSTYEIGFEEIIENQTNESQ